MNAICGVIVGVNDYRKVENKLKTVRPARNYPILIYYNSHSNTQTLPISFKNVISKTEVIRNYQIYLIIYLTETNLILLSYIYSDVRNIDITN